MRNYYSNFKIKRLLIGIFLFSAIAASAQDITGKVIDGNSKQTIPNAGIALYGSTGSLISSTISTSTGTFDLHYKLSGVYRLRVSFVGYQTYERDIKLDGQGVSVGTLSLKEKTQDISEVVVKASVPLATQRGDTTVMNASAYKTNPDANVQDLVQKMPGIVVQNGTLQAHGEDVKQVLVDGKEFFKDDITAALKNLPASIVNEIQIYDSQSEQTRFTGFDDGNRLKTINIVTKTGVTKSQFGRLYAGAGSDKLYSAGGNLSLFRNDRRITIIGQTNNTNERNFAMGNIFAGGGNPNGPPGAQIAAMGGGSSSSDGVNNYSVDTQNGINKINSIGFNYSDQLSKKIKLDGNYFFSSLNNTSAQSSLYDYTARQGQSYLENKNTTAHVVNHRFNFRLDYDIDDRNSLFIRPNISFQQSDGTSRTLAHTDSVSKPLSAFSSSTAPSLTGATISGQILFRHKFDRKGRTLSLDVNSTSQTKNGNNYLNSITDYYTSNTVDTIREYSNLHSTGYSFSANASYTEPINRRSMIMFNYMYGYQTGKSNQKAFNYNSKTGLYDDPDLSLTSIYKSNYQTNSGGMSYLYHTRKMNLNTNLNYQHGTLKGENELSNAFAIPSKTYNNLLPSMMLRYSFSSMANLQVDYRTSASAPSIAQLQEVLDKTNPTQLTVGNSHLAQTYQHSLNVRLIAPNTSTASVFMAFINGSLSNNFIASNTLIAHSDTLLSKYNQTLAKGGQLTTYQNLSGYYNLNGMVGYGFPFTAIKTNLHLMLNANASRTPSIINNQKNYSKQFSWGGNLVMSSNISQNVDFTINSRANFSSVNNTLPGQTDTHFWNLSSGANLTWIALNHIVFQSGYSFSGYFQQGSKNEITNMLNCSLGVKFLKKNAGDLRFSCNDLLNQNTNFSRSTTPLYTLTHQSNVVGRYYMLTFTYTLGNFNGGNQGAPRPM
ncbi:outer membrane beta-barrel protein [Paludibacter sp.]|uniref:outer membrane beta-barrel protein n=1 Tax=Paludibacter sp. TaxID=1898105 RepID=UPI001353ED25|nr:outer membrane beta-barrel protein [Paludibacter sp.]MTK53135.1 outer membrane beta-barrel protein [Paludibacter sp.]